MKTTTTNRKRITVKSVLSLVMVLALLMGFGTVFAGCSEEAENDKAARYEGLQGAAYMQALEGDILYEAVDTFGSIYSSMYKNQTGASGSAGTRMDMSVMVSDDLLSILEQQLPPEQDVDLSFLSSLSLSTETGTDGQLNKNQTVISLNGQKLLTINSLVDLSQYVLYLGIPELTGTYIKTDMGEMMGGNPMDIDAMYQLMAKGMSDEKELTTLLKRYIGVAIKELNNVQQTTTVLQEGNLQQECTQLTLKIYEADFMRMCKAVLTAARNDAELKKFIVNYISAGAEMSAENIDPEAAYTEFQKSIDEALAEMNSETDFDTVSYIELVTYVDKNHDVIGRKFGISDEGTLFYYHTVTEGEKFAFKAASDSLRLCVEGMGTENDDKMSGNFTLTVSDMKVLVVNVENASEESGTITLAPTEMAEKMLFGMSSSPFKKLSVQLQYNQNGGQLNLLSENKSLISLAMLVTATNGPDLSIPSSAIVMDNELAVQQWQATFNEEQLIENLRKAGVPEELLGH